jgi:hypothetical protein
MILLSRGLDKNSQVRGLPLIHEKTVDEWGTAVLGYFMTGPPAYAPSIRGMSLDLRRAEPENSHQTAIDLHLREA